MRRIEQPNQREPQARDGFSVFDLRPNSRGYRLPDGRNGAIPPIQILYSPSEGLTLDAIRDRIQKELQRHGHAESEPIAGCVLAIVALAHPKDRLPYLNAILDSVTTADLTQIVVLPTLNELTYRVRFGSFEIAPLDLDRLRYRSERAGSDFFELWGDRVVEFKRPMRKDYADKDNPIAQVYRYANDLRSGQAKDKDQRVISIPKDSVIHAYVIADLTKKLREFADFATLKPYPDNSGYFGYNETCQVWVEVWSYDRVIDDALKRNEVFFTQLGLT